MPDPIFKAPFAVVRAWDESMVIQLLEQLPVKLGPELDKAIDGVCAKTPEMAWVVDCNRLAAFTIKEIRWLMGLKKRTALLALLCEDKQARSLVDQGVAKALPNFPTLKKALGSFGRRFKPKIDAEFINPFIAATAKVLAIQGGLDAKVGKPFLCKEPSKPDVCGVITLTGPIVSGMILLEFPSSVFLKVASQALGETQTLITPEIAGFAAELCNMIYGTVRTQLNDQGYSLQPALPIVLQGGHPGIGAPGSKIALGIPLESTAGTFQLSIWIDL